MSRQVLPAPPEAIASGTDDRFGATSRKRGASYMGPAGKTVVAETDSFLSALSGLPPVAAEEV